MSTGLSSKKPKEEDLIRKFFKSADIPLHDLQMQDRPDARAACLINGTPRTIGIELVEYQLDATDSGGSKGRRLAKLHSAIWAHLNAKLRQDLAVREVDGYLFYDKSCLPRMVAAEHIADELHRFCVDNRDTLVEECKYYAFSRHGEEFQAHMLLSKHFEKILLGRWNVEPRQMWYYSTMMIVGVKGRIVASLIANKSHKGSTYAWGDVDEKWLLICAGATLLPCDSAGGMESQARRQLTSPEVAPLVEESVFDRVALWEKNHRWFVIVPE